MLICKASSAHGCSPLTTLNQNFMQKGILEC
ncbi:phosphomannomutase, partial [Brucella suis]